MPAATTTDTTAPAADATATTDTAPAADATTTTDTAAPADAAAPADPAPADTTAATDAAPAADAPAADPAPVDVAPPPADAPPEVVPGLPSFLIRRSIYGRIDAIDEPFDTLDAAKARADELFEDGVASIGRNFDWVAVLDDTLAIVYQRTRS